MMSVARDEGSVTLIHRSGVRLTTRVHVPSAPFKGPNVCAVCYYSCCGARLFYVGSS